MHRFLDACEGLLNHDEKSFFIDTNEFKSNQPSVAVTVFALFPVITDQRFYCVLSSFKNYPSY